MTRSLVTMLTGTLAAGALALCLSSAPAQAQVEIVVQPPDDFIATTDPVYFEGHAAYYWGNRWYYRDGGRWGYYHDEPGYLHDWRGHHEFNRHYYGRAHGGGYYGHGGYEHEREHEHGGGGHRR